MVRGFIDCTTIGRIAPKTALIVSSSELLRDY